MQLIQVILLSLLSGLETTGSVCWGPGVRKGFLEERKVALEYPVQAQPWRGMLGGAVRMWGWRDRHSQSHKEGSADSDDFWSLRCLLSFEHRAHGLGA